MKKTNLIKPLGWFLSIILVIGVISSFLVFSEDDSDTSKSSSAVITSCEHLSFGDWQAFANYHSGKCNSCSKIEYFAHEYGNDNFCDFCGTEKTEVVEEHECFFDTAIRLELVESTCTVEGCYKSPCKFKGCEKTKEFPLDIIPHQYKGNWSDFDDTHHKQMCKMCNSAYRLEEHTFNSYVSKPATSSSEGERTFVCGVCQKTVKEIIPALGDTSDTTVSDSTQSPDISKCIHSKATYIYDNLLYHTMTCPDCNESTKSMHLCLEYNTPEYNSFISGDATKHKKSCVCGLGYNALTLEAEHSFSVSTDKCIYCGACEWHRYTQIVSVYDDVLDEYVNQYVCESCGYAKTYSCDPVFVDKVKSTCITKGYSEAECSDCRGTIVLYKALAAHSYSGGSCSVCKAIDPDYVPNVPDTGCNHSWGDPISLGDYSFCDDYSHYQSVISSCIICDEQGDPHSILVEHSYNASSGRCELCGYYCAHNGKTSGICSICNYYIGSSSGSNGNVDCGNASQHGSEYVYIGCSPYDGGFYEYTLYYSCEFCSYSMTTTEYASNCLGLDSCAHSSVSGDGSSEDCDHSCSWLPITEGCITYGVCSNCGEYLTESANHSYVNGVCTSCGVQQ